MPPARHHTYQPASASDIMFRHQCGALSEECFQPQRNWLLCSAKPESSGLQARQMGLRKLGRQHIGPTAPRWEAGRRGRREATS